MTKPDFLKIFAQNGAITELTDSQFLQGFDYLGDNPPTKEEFNWLFQQLSLKLQYLNLQSEPLFWQSSKAYAVGDICYSASASSYKRMECTVAGASGTTEPSWSAVGQTVTDGTVTWLVRDANLETNLSSTASGKGASIIGVADTAGVFTGSNVENVLAELSTAKKIMAKQNVVAAGTYNFDLSTFFPLTAFSIFRGVVAVVGDNYVYLLPFTACYYNALVGIDYSTKMIYNSESAVAPTLGISGNTIAVTVPARTNGGIRLIADWSPVD